MDYQACCEPISTASKHGSGKGLMTKYGASVKRHGIGKGLMTKNGAPVKGHGIGKGLMTKESTSVMKHGIGKGLQTKKSLSMKKHGIGKGLMTVWRVTNPSGGDFPTGIGSSTSSNLSLLARKKNLPRKQSLMVRRLIHFMGS